MDLVDKIARTDFLGREFMLWLWFASEALEAEIPLNDQNVAELWFDDQMILALPDNAQEKSTLKGVAPSGTPEAREALRQGKMPVRAHVSLTLGERCFTFNLDAAPFALSAVKLPSVVTDGIDEQFYERMMLLDQVEEIMGGLLERFTRLRLSRTWTSTHQPLLEQWVCESPSFDAQKAKKALLKALAVRD